MNMTGMADNEVKQVTNKKKTLAEVDTTVTKEAENDFEEQLFDVPFSITYAHMLCTLAEIHHFNNQFESSLEYLSSAMKAIDFHDHDIRIQPALGRILRHLAMAYMQSSQAVKAEGLFRAALEKLSSPYGLHDIRYQYEAALAKGFYGRLLTKWEKREMIGNQYRDEAKILLEQAVIQPTDAVASSPLPKFVFTSLLQFPHHQ